jgi:hypothetical protein
VRPFPSPCPVPLQALAALCEAQTLALDKFGSSAPKLPDQVGPWTPLGGGAAAGSGPRRRAAGAACHHAVAAPRPAGLLLHLAASLGATTHPNPPPPPPHPPPHPQVYAYTQGMYTLAADAAKTRRSASAAAFRAALATAAARAGGARCAPGGRGSFWRVAAVLPARSLALPLSKLAQPARPIAYPTPPLHPPRYKPEIAAAVAALPRKTPDGLPVEMGLDLDKDLKVGPQGSWAAAAWRPPRSGRSSDSRGRARCSSPCPAKELRPPARTDRPARLPSVSSPKIPAGRHPARRRRRRLPRRARGRQAPARGAARAGSRACSRTCHPRKFRRQPLETQASAHPARAAPAPPSPSRQARGYKVATVAQAAFEAAKDDKGRAGVVLAAIKAAAGGAGKVAALERQLAAPFDPYAE